MKAARLWQATRLNLRRDRRGFVLSAGGVAVGVAAFVFFVALGRGVGRVVRERIFPVDARLVRVVPPTLSLGRFLGGGVLDDGVVDRLQALPGVRHAWRELALKVPAVSRYDGRFFGRPLRLGLEIVGVGVDPGYVAGELGRGRRFADPGDTGPVPVVVARRLLDLYDESFAAARGLPRITPKMIEGFRFPLTLGESYVTTAGVHGAPRTVDLEVAGVGDRAILGGVTLPLATVRRWNAAYGVKARGYQAVILEAADPGAVPGVMAAVRRMGFEVDTRDRRLASQAGAVVTVTTVSLSLLSVLILALAAVNIARAAFAQVAARTRELGLMRALGARRGDVRAMVLAEAAVAGLAGGVLGVVLGVSAGHLANLAAARWLPPFPFKPGSFFAYGGWLVPAALGAAILASILGAVVPAARAARLDPARAISGG